MRKLLIASTLLVCATGASAAQQELVQEPLFRSDVDMVLHAVAVLGPDGEPVMGLNELEFTVYEDDERMQLSVFLSPDNNPLEIALVVDSSASLYHYARTVRTAAKSFLSQLGPLDCVYLLPFNDEVGPGTWERGLLLTRRVDGMFMQGGTALYDALIHGLDILGRRSVATPSRTGCGADPTVAGAVQRRRAVVLLSDGADRNSQGRYDEVLDLARATSVPVFPVIHGEAQRDDRLRLGLQRLAGETGGTVVDAAGPTEIQRAFEDVILLLRASYLVGYLPPEGDGRPGEHEVRVRSRPGFRLVYRTSYWR